MDYLREDIRNIVKKMDLTPINITREVGWTDYMEGLDHDDLPWNVTIGNYITNGRSRFFLAIKLTNGEVVVVFQRYQGHDLMVNNGLRSLDAVVGDKHWDIIRDLLTIGSCSYPNMYREGKMINMKTGRDRRLGIRRCSKIHDVIIKYN